MKTYTVSANGRKFSVKATTRRTAVVAAMLEMLRSGYAKLLNFDAERVAAWHIMEVK